MGLRSAPLDSRSEGRVMDLWVELLVVGSWWIELRGLASGSVGLSDVGGTLK